MGTSAPLELRPQDSVVPAKFTNKLSIFLASYTLDRMSPASAQTESYTNLDFEVGKHVFASYAVVKMVESLADGRGNAIFKLPQIDDVADSYDCEKAAIFLASQFSGLPRKNPAGNETHKDFLFKIIGYSTFVRPGNLSILIDRLPLSPIPGKQRVKADTTATEKAVVFQDGAEHAATPMLLENASISDPDDWRYTSTLWEMAQSKGVVPRVTDKCINSYPPKFRVTIEFMGIQGSGTARNKKTAKHFAAKTVCYHLGYHVSSE